MAEAAEDYWDYTRVKLTGEEFVRLRDFIFDNYGISIKEHKKSLLESRLSKRLRFYQFRSYTPYIEKVFSDSFENQMMIDLVSTNETSFFREPKHFEFLTDTIVKSHKPSDPLKIWSAASSTGEEAYTIAMVLDKSGHKNWQIHGTDINQQVLNVARRGLYAVTAASKIPDVYLNKYCLRGVKEQDGLLLISKSLREHTRFSQLNLVASSWPSVEIYDVIFLRNVMIYFEKETKQQILTNMVEHLRPGGYLFIGHSESLININVNLKQISPSIYRKPE